MNNASYGQLPFIHLPSELKMSVNIVLALIKFKVSFHCSNIDGITGFSEDESLAVFNLMKHAIHIAKSGISVNTDSSIDSFSFISIL